jgi:hypothetical protein
MVVNYHWIVTLFFFLAIFRDAERCFRYNAFYNGQNHFVFVGDSRLRQLYLATRLLLETGVDPTDVVDVDHYLPPIHGDLSWEQRGQNLKLDFFWAPFPNKTMIEVKTLAQHMRVQSRLSDHPLSVPDIASSAIQCWSSWSA